MFAHRKSRSYSTLQCQAKITRKEKKERERENSPYSSTFIKLKKKKSNEIPFHFAKCTVYEILPHKFHSPVPYYQRLLATIMSTKVFEICSHCNLRIIHLEPDCLWFLYDHFFFLICLFCWLDQMDSMEKCDFNVHCR